jgi:four helix bundle protein
MNFALESYEVRRRAIAFADGMLSVADALPETLQLSLREQLRRAALSIPTNLAEGCECNSVQDSSDFYRTAKGAVYEVVSLLLTIGKQGYLSPETYREHCREADCIAEMITGAIESLTVKHPLTSL